MKAKLQQKLFKKFPKFFKDKALPMSQTCMCWGIDFGDGWYSELEKTLDRLDLIRKKSGITTIGDQLKEKFGTARFYFHLEPDDHSEYKLDGEFNLWQEIIWDVVGRFESRTTYICEECGKSGELCHKGTWLLTLCKKHRKKFGYEELEDR